MSEVDRIVDEMKKKITQTETELVEYSINGPSMCLVVENSSVSKFLEGRGVAMDFFEDALITVSCDVRSNPQLDFIRTSPSVRLRNRSTARSYNFVLYGLKEKILEIPTDDVEKSILDGRIVLRFIVGVLIPEQ